MTAVDIRVEAQSSAAGVGDYLSLLKPRVMSLVVFTAAVGLLAAPGHVDPVLAIVGVLAIAVGAGASGALNMWFDADIDRLMTRTAGRAVPAGRIARSEAAALGLALSIFATLALALADGYLAAGLLAFTIFFYAVVYTMLLKRSTAQNIVIGGAAGALPPVIGWAAATGEAPLAAWALFLIIFLWTPAHFWALALRQQSDYARPKIPMMPNVAGARATQNQILFYAALTVLASAFPFALGSAGAVYAAVAMMCASFFLRAAWLLFRARAQAVAGPAKSLFGASILYLFLVFAGLLADRALVGAI
ncbi:MAG: heme o synthase [Alphaproteobacteria bacterium]